MSFLPLFGENTAWRFPGAGLDFDFQNSRYYQQGYGSDINSLLSVTRASTGYAQDTAGNWVQFANNTPRITNQGLLVEESRTNSIRNNSMQGATAGVVGSGGTLPTNWSVVGGQGLVTTVVGIGTVNGISYIDLRINGTTATNTFYILNFDSITTTASTVWSEDFFCAMVGGSLTNITNAENILRWSGGSNAITTFTLSSTLTWIKNSGTAPASTTSVSPAFSLIYSTGVAVDITIRIGWPKAEVGSFTTSPISTSGTAATRAADVVSIKTLPTLGSAFSVFASTVMGDVTESTTRYILAESTNNRFLYTFTNNSAVTMYNGTTTLQATAGSGTWTGGDKAAAAINASGRSICMGDGTVATDSNTNSVPSTIYIGGIGSTFGSNYFRRVALWNQKLPDATLQQITT